MNDIIVQFLILFNYPSFLYRMNIWTIIPFLFSINGWSFYSCRKTWELEIFTSCLHCSFTGDSPQSIARCLQRVA